MLPPKEFLKNIKPFSYLSEDELEFLVKNLRAEAFEEGETIVRGGEKAKKVYVIFSGSVSLYEDGTLVDVARRGDIIGLGIEGGKVRYTAVAREDTICYEIPKKAFDRLMESNENFRKFFESFVEGDFASVRKDNVLFEQFLYKPVRELLTKDPVVCSAVTSLREAVSEMEFNRVGSIVVVDEEKRPLGILTNADLRRFIVYGGNLEERVSAYMSRPPITVEANRPIFDAYVEFLRRGINHLIVTENGRVRGVITAKDVLSHFEPTASVIIYTRKLAKAGSTEELAAVYTNIKKAVAAMAVKGLHFYELTSIISDVYDLLT
ncbi:MAG: CBS domain-containing protein, partial [Archaeoglobaceae archaeon]